MKKKYLPLYRKWIRSGELPDHGLCDCIENCFGYKERNKFISLFRPQGNINGLWGYDGENYIGICLGDSYARIAYSFNDLRQNMILLMAAMNNEL